MNCSWCGNSIDPNTEEDLAKNQICSQGCMDASMQWCFEVLMDLSSSELKEVFTGFFAEGDEGDVVAKELESIR